MEKLKEMFEMWAYMSIGLSATHVVYGTAGIILMNVSLFVLNTFPFSLMATGLFGTILGFLVTFIAVVGGFGSFYFFAKIIEELKNLLETADFLHPLLRLQIAITSSIITLTALSYVVRHI